MRALRDLWHPKRKILIAPGLLFSGPGAAFNGAGQRGSAHHPFRAAHNGTGRARRTGADDHAATRDRLAGTSAGEQKCVLIIRSKVWLD